MKRSSTALLVLGLAVGYCALIVIGIAVFQQESEVASIEARLAPSPPAQPGSSVAPQPGPCSVTNTVVEPRVSPSPNTSGAPQIQWVTDTAGRYWDNHYPQTLRCVKSGTKFTFTAFATDPLNRPLEYMFVQISPLADQRVVCSWGGATCSWTAQGTLNQNVTVGVAVRDNEPLHLLGPGLCTHMSPSAIDAPTDSCDDEWVLYFQIGR